MAFSKARRLSDFIASDGTIPTGKFASSSITSSHLVDGTIAHADLHTNMDLTGKTVLVANASTGDNDTTAANTAFVQQEIAALVDSSPSALNTLNELAAALGDDANFSTTVTNSIATKLPLAGGSLTGNLLMRNGGNIELGGYNSGNDKGLILTPQDGSTYWHVYNAAGGHLAFGASNTIGSTEKMRIKGDGNVGIGTNNPTRKLSVKRDTTITSGFNDITEFLDTTIGAGGSVSLNVGRANSTRNLGKMAFKFAGAGSTDNALNFGFYDADNLMSLTAAGNVGIGIAAPAHKLHVLSTDNKGFLLDRNTGNEPANLNEFSSYYSLSIKNRASGSYLNFGGSASHTKLQATDGAGSATAKIISLNPYGGNVGIGLAAPEGPLHIRSSSNETIIADFTISSGSFTWQTFRRNNTRKWRITGDGADTYLGFYNDTTSTHDLALKNSNGYLGVGTTSPDKPLHLKRTSGWATMRLEGASDSGGEIEFYAGSNLKAKMWADNSAGDIYVRAGGNDTTAKFDADGNWVSPHEDNIKRNFIGRGPFNVMDFSDTWHEYYNPAANTEHHISGSMLNPMGITMAFPSNVTKKILQHDRTPTGSVGVIYEAVSDTNNTYNGGFNTDNFKIDPDKGYIMGYYVRRLSSASDGTHYGGFSHGVSAGTGSSVDSNPYFQAFGNGNLPQGVWCLCYFQIHPRYYTGTGDGGIAGVYRCDNGTRLLGQTAWKHPVNQTQQHLRSYNYYCANSAVSIQWYSPFVYEVTGFEPTVAAMLGRGI